MLDVHYTNLMLKLESLEVAINSLEKEVCELRNPLTTIKPEDLSINFIADKSITKILEESLFDRIGGDRLPDDIKPSDIQGTRCKRNLP
jgi:hypothetical protein